MKLAMKSFQQIYVENRNYHKLNESISIMKYQRCNIKMVKDLTVKEYTLIKFLYNIRELIII